MNESVSKEREIVLVDLLDRILYKGVVLWGDITISVADVDLVYLGLKVLLTSVDKAEEMRHHMTNLGKPAQVPAAGAARDGRP